MREYMRRLCVVAEGAAGLDLVNRKARRPKRTRILKWLDPPVWARCYSTGGKGMRLIGRLFRLGGFFAAALAVASAPVVAQTAHTTRNTNLRRNPSTNQAPIRLLPAEETLRLLSNRPSRGFYHVLTSDSISGWAASRNLRVDTGAVATVVAPSVPGATRVAIVAPIESGPVGSVSTVGCGDSLWRHVYHPFRLVIKQQCITVTGTIVDASAGRNTDGARHEGDGDTHGWIKLDPQFANMLNLANQRAQHGHLVFELVCHYSATQRDAKPACKGFVDHTRIPPIGTHIEITGTYVQDKEHDHWHEIHPVSRLVAKP